MNGAGKKAIEAWLHRWRNLEECLLHEVYVSPDLYRVVLKFNYVWSPLGTVRDRILEEPMLVTLVLIGVEHLTLFGALTEGMKQHPERIDWGLKEVAAVRVHAHDGNIELTVEWESDRRIAVKCLDIELIDAIT